MGKRSGSRARSGKSSGVGSQVSKGSKISNTSNALTISNKSDPKQGPASHSSATNSSPILTPTSSSSGGSQVTSSFQCTTNTVGSGLDALHNTKSVPPSFPLQQWDHEPLRDGPWVAIPGQHFHLDSFSLIPGYCIAAAQAIDGFESMYQEADPRLLKY